MEKIVDKDCEICGSDYDKDCEICGSDYDKDCEICGSDYDKDCEICESDIGNHRFELSSHSQLSSTFPVKSSNNVNNQTEDQISRTILPIIDYEIGFQLISGNILEFKETERPFERYDIQYSPLQINKHRGPVIARQKMYYISDKELKLKYKEMLDGKLKMLHDIFSDDQELRDFRDNYISLINKMLANFETVELKFIIKPIIEETNPKKRLKKDDDDVENDVENKIFFDDDDVENDVENEINFSTRLLISFVEEVLESEERAIESMTTRKSLFLYLKRKYIYFWDSLNRWFEEMKNYQDIKSSIFYDHFIKTHTTLKNNMNNALTKNIKGLTFKQYISKYEKIKGKIATFEKNLNDLEDLFTNKNKISDVDKVLHRVPDYIFKMTASIIVDFETSQNDVIADRAFFETMTEKINRNNGLKSKNDTIKNIFNNIGVLYEDFTKKYVTFFKLLKVIFELKKKLVQTIIDYNITVTGIDQELLYKICKCNTNVFMQNQLKKIDRFKAEYNTVNIFENDSFYDLLDTLTQDYEGKITNLPADVFFSIFRTKMLHVNQEDLERHYKILIIKRYLLDIRNISPFSNDSFSNDYIDQLKKLEKEQLERLQHVELEKKKKEDYIRNYPKYDADFIDHHFLLTAELNNLKEYEFVQNDKNFKMLLKNSLDTSLFFSNIRELEKIKCRTIDSMTTWMDKNTYSTQNQARSIDLKNIYEFQTRKTQAYKNFFDDESN